MYEYHWESTGIQKFVMDCIWVGRARERALLLITCFLLRLLQLLSFYFGLAGGAEGAMAGGEHVMMKKAGKRRANKHTTTTHISQTQNGDSFLFIEGRRRRWNEESREMERRRKWERETGKVSSFCALRASLLNNPLSSFGSFFL